MRVQAPTIQLGPLRLTLLQFLPLFVLPWLVFAFIFHVNYIFLLGIILCIAAMVIFYLINESQFKNRRFDYIDTFVFPERIHQSLATKHPHLTTEQIDLVMQGLRHFFKMHVIIRRTYPGRMVAMPSQVIDDAWHEFILFTRQYEQFSKKAFGKFLHHTPAEAMPSTVCATQSLKTAWATACTLERINPSRPHRLPLVFDIDRQLDIKDGFHYVIDCTKTITPGKTSFCATHIGCGGGGHGGAGGSDGGGSTGSDDNSGGGSSCGGGCGGE